MRARVARPPIVSQAPSPSNRKVFAHWFPPMPRSIDNGATANADYYGAQFLAPSGEGGIHAAYGGYLRDRPVFRSPLPGNWSLTDAQWDIAKAIEYGIDGFCVNIMGITGTYWNRFLTMLTAAQSFPGFKIIPMADLIATPSTVTATQWADALYPYLNQASIQTYNGLPVVSSFYAERFGASFWQTFITRMQTLGRPVAFMPCGLDPQVSAFAPISFGISYWGGRSTNENSTAIGNQVKALGKVLMIPVCPQDYRPSSRVYWEASNTGLFRQMWGIAESTNADWVQIVTWNDFTEHTHIVTSANYGDALMWLSGYYAAKFKNGGVAPAITKDRLIVVHRKHAHSLVPSTQTQLAGLSNGSTAPSNNVEVLAFLTQARTLTINVGATEYTESAPAGLSIWSKALGTGVIEASVSTVTCTSPHTVVSSAAYQDLQYKYTMAVAP